MEPTESVSKPIDLDHTEMAELEALLDDVAARARRVSPTPLEGLSNSQQLALALFVSAFEVYLGIKALLKERLSEEARMLSRPLLDDSARLAYLASSPELLEERVLRFLNDSLEHETRLNKVALANGEAWAEAGLERIAGERAALKSEAEEVSVALDPLPKPREMLESLGQPKLYYWHVRASNNLHSSVIGLSSRFYQQEDGSSLTIPLRGTDKEVAQVGVMAMQALTFAVIAFADIVVPERKDELVEYRKKIVRLTGDLYARIGMGVLALDQYPTSEP